MTAGQSFQGIAQILVRHKKETISREVLRHAGLCGYVYSSDLTVLTTDASMVNYMLIVWE
jgi:IS30 family transposase